MKVLMVQVETAKVAFYGQLEGENVYLGSLELDSGTSEECPARLRVGLP